MPARVGVAAQRARAPRRSGRRAGRPASATRATARRRPGPRSPSASRPLVPDRHAALLQPVARCRRRAGTRAAPATTDLRCTRLVVTSGKPSRQVGKRSWCAEHAARAGAGAVALGRAVRHDVAEQVLVLGVGPLGGPRHGCHGSQRSPTSGRVPRRPSRTAVGWSACPARLRPTSTPAPFGRVLTAMVTPFTDDGALDLDAAAAAGHPPGRPGQRRPRGQRDDGGVADHDRRREGRTCSGPCSRRSATAPWSSPGSAPTTPRTRVELARQAAEAGAHGLLVVTPYYNKPPQAGAARALHRRRRRHRAAGDALRHPRPHRRRRSATETLRPRWPSTTAIVAVKDAKGDLFEGAWVMARSDLAYYSGDDAAEPRLARARRRRRRERGRARRGPQYARDGRGGARAATSTTAQRIYRELLPAVRGIMTRTQGAIMVKAALQLQGVLELARRPAAAGRGRPPTRCRLLSRPVRVRPAGGTRVSHPHPELSAAAAARARCPARRPARRPRRGRPQHGGARVSTASCWSSTAACSSPRTTSPAST